MDARYGWTGWEHGEELDPPEPGKEWLTIGPLNDDGTVTDELAVIVHRPSGHPDSEKWRADKVARAELIVAALNSFGRIATMRETWGEFGFWTDGEYGRGGGEFVTVGELLGDLTEGD